MGNGSSRGSGAMEQAARTFRHQKKRKLQSWHWLAPNSAAKFWSLTRGRRKKSSESRALFGDLRECFNSWAQLALWIGFLTVNVVILMVVACCATCFLPRMYRR